MNYEMEFSDKEIVEQYLKGDVYAFELLIKKYEKGIYRYCYRFTGNSADAEDMAQQTFIKVFENIEKVDLERSLKPWIYTVATNLCRTLYRKKKEVNFSELEGDESENEGSSENYFEDESVDIPGKVTENEIKGRVQQALKKIPKKYATVLTLYYIEEFSYEEMAKMLEIPLNTVRTHLKRGKEKMSEELRVV